jgi:hypothetical protein
MQLCGVVCDLNEPVLFTSFPVWYVILYELFNFGLRLFLLGYLAFDQVLIIINVSLLFPIFVIHLILWSLHSNKQIIRDNKFLRFNTVFLASHFISVFICSISITALYFSSYRNMLFLYMGVLLMDIVSFFYGLYKRYIYNEI